MVKSESPKWSRYRLALLERILRWWSYIYLGYTVPSMLAALGNHGPDGLLYYLDRYFPLFQYAYLRQLAQDNPALFWCPVALLTLLALAGLVLDLRAFLRRFSRPSEVSQDSHDWQREQYLKAVEERFKVIPLVIDPKKVGRLPQLVYQRLEYLNDPTRPAAEENATQNNRPGLEAEDVLQVLEAGGSQCAIILGEPGGGKTTLLWHSMSRIAAQLRETRGIYLPIYLSLPQFAPFLADRTDHDPVSTYLRSEPELRGIPEFARNLAALVHSGEAILILDGLDEVTNFKNRTRVINWIRERQRGLTLHGVLVVSTRFTDYDRDTLMANDNVEPFAVFKEWVAQQMNPTIRRKLAGGLLPALFEQMKKTQVRKTLRNDRAPDPAAFVKLIARHPQGSLWGGNPLLFSLAAYVYVQNLARGSGELPQSRVTLFRQFITSLVTKSIRVRDDVVYPEERESVLLHQSLRALAEFALWATRQQAEDEVAQLSSRLGTAAGIREQASSRTYKDVRIRTALQQVLGVIGTQRSADELTTWVINSGVLQVVAEDGYQFRHNTYREYLTALALAQRLAGEVHDHARLEAEQLTIEHMFTPSWAQPMRMLAGALVAEGLQGWDQGRRTAQRWLQELRIRAMRQAAPGDIADDALELAIASLFDIPDIETFGQEVDAAVLLETWADRVMKLAQAADDAGHRPRQRLLRDGKSPRSEYDDVLGRLQRLAPGVALLPAHLAQPALNRFQRALADASHPALQVTAAHALEGMGDLVALEPLSHLLLTQGGKEHVLARTAAARALAKLEASDLTHPGHGILERALNSGDVVLGRIVADALAEAGDVALPLMLVAIAPDKDTEVRRRAVLALETVGEQAKVRLHKLLNDPEAVVALAAVEALARLGGDFWNLLSIFTKIARRSGETENLRRTLEAIIPRTLRQLGFTVHVLRGMPVIVPPLREVPAGPFLMGSDPRKDRWALDDELPQHPVTVGTFQIGTYPVTVAEYACAVQGRAVPEPEKWSSQLKELDHPVVYISLQDATDYARWLSNLTGQTWRLPTEAEREKAARGTTGHIYPWGDHWDKVRANTNNGGPGTTTPVGAYADHGDESPYGLHDAAGNVWEWSSSIFTHYHDYHARSGEHEDSLGPGGRVLRGGSWVGTPRHARTAYRNLVSPRFVDRGIGFRLVRGIGFLPARGIGSPDAYRNACESG